MSETGRPTREQVLATLQAQQRARLRICIGAAPGLGKTYTMIEDAHALRREGVDVVIGFVETHGRIETEARARDLEVVPRRRVEYRGVTLEEMDLDAILARRPALCVIDELAHTNAPGGRHAKKYQVFGQSARTRWEILLKGSTLNRFLQEAGDAAVQIVLLAGR